MTDSNYFSITEVTSQLAVDAATLSVGQCRLLQTTLPGSVLVPETSPIIRTASSAVWDPVRREVRFIGKMQQSNPYHFLVYDEPTNVWSLDKYPLPSLAQSGHAYDHNAVDLTTGDHYFRPYNSLTIQKWNGSSWSALPTIDIGGTNTQVACTISGMPEGLFFFDANRVVYYNGTSWVSFGDDPNLAYHTLSEYNAPSDTLIYGGGNDENRMWKLPPNRVITQIANAPTTLNILGDRVRLCSDPASGGFLLQKGLTNSWWYYSVSADTWTSVSQSTGDGSSPQSGAPNLGGEEHVIATPIDEYGVSMWIQYTSPTTDANVWLYRHA